MADFYAARRGIIPPLPWPTFSPPFSFVCRAAIAEIMGRDLSGISATTRAGIVRLEYTRTDDGTRWRYACRLQDDRVVWAGVEGGQIGRWRNHPADEQITYSLTDQGVTIVQDFGDSTIHNQ